MNRQTTCLNQEGPMRGQIGLVSGGTDITAKLIRLVTMSHVHHTIIGLGDGLCISAEPQGVKVMPVAHYPRVEWLPPMGTTEQLEAVAWHATNMIGQPYNRIAFILAGLDALKLIPGWAQQPLADWADDHGVTCSALVDLVHLAADIDLLDGPSIYTWPGELAALKPPPLVTEPSA